MNVRETTSTARVRGEAFVAQLEKDGLTGHQIELVLSAAFTAFRRRQKELGSRSRTLSATEIERRATISDDLPPESRRR